MSNISRLPQWDSAYTPGKGFDSVCELMRAIMLRAIEDYNSPGELREEAIKYFFGLTGANSSDCSQEDNEEYIFSFKNICGHLGLDPDKTRYAIMNATHRISTRRRAA